MVSRDAGAPLRGLVRNYTGYVERSAEPLCRREVPSGDVTLILSPGSALSLPDGRHTSFLAALHESHTLVEHDGHQEGVEVHLTPLGARALFGLPMHELSNRVVELDDLLGRGADELIERMWEAPSWDRRFAVLDEALAFRADRAPRPESELAWAWGRLRSSAGRARVSGLAEELGWSHRRLIASLSRGHRPGAQDDWGGCCASSACLGCCSRSRSRAWQRSLSIAATTTRPTSTGTFASSRAPRRASTWPGGCPPAAA